jgi:hypothetical protein
MYPQGGGLLKGEMCLLHEAFKWCIEFLETLAKRVLKLLEQGTLRI